MIAVGMTFGQMSVNAKYIISLINQSEQFIQRQVVMKHNS